MEQSFALAMTTVRFPLIEENANSSTSQKTMLSILLWPPPIKFDCGVHPGCPV